MSDPPPISPVPPPSVDFSEPFDANVVAAFALIETAARMIAVVNPAAIAHVIRRGIDVSFILDPTLAMRVMRQRADMDRKLRILDDAARLIGNWDIVREAPRG